MNSTKKFLSALLVLTFLIYVLPAAIALPTSGNTINDNATNDNATNDNATNDNATTVDLIADFDSDVTCGYAPLTVNFNDTSEGEPTSWNWDFGDGTNSTVENPVHTYCHSGKYDITLTVTNEMGSNTTIKDDYISVGAPRQSHATDEECAKEVKKVCENTKPVCGETKSAKPVCKQTSQADDNKVVKETKPAKPVCKVTKPAKPVCKETEPAKPVCKETEPAKPVCKETEPAKPVCKETKPVKPVCKETKPVKPICEETNQADDSGDVSDNTNQADDSGDVSDATNQADDSGESNTAKDTNGNPPAT
jgi:PKD repeat protein